MARVYQVPQHAFLWLMVGAALAVAPHLIAGPPWLLALVLALGGWRLLVQRGRLRMPGKVIRVAVLAVAVVATLYTYGTVLGPQAGVTLLICAFMLKLLEMFRLRDAYVAIVLSYFVLATVLLLYQGIFSALYVVVALAVVTAALIGINRAEAGVRAGSHFGYASVIALQALPLMLVLFVLVPRVNPLWDLPQAEPRARTGISDSMAPGEVSDLSLSRELAFRVEFEGAVPPPPLRYWRGLTYSWFDGRRWTQAAPQGLPRRELLWFGDGAVPDWVRALREQRQGPEYVYRITQEPTGRPWLFTMAVPFPQSPGVGLVRDYRLLNEEDLLSVRALRVTSYPAMPRHGPLPDWERSLNLQLPVDASPRARALAQRWRAEAVDDQAYVRRVLNWYREEEFHYTLQPPRLGEQPVDEFLFRTRRGFCEHFASSMAVLLRAAGIPARIVAGYQGGEMNALGSHMLVHQYDAHAWVDAWLPGRGWVELDPTAMVAPERIERGLREALGAEGGGLGFNTGGATAGLGMRLRHLADYVQFSWTKWVLGYNTTTQTALLERLLKEVSPLRIAMALAASVLSLMLVMATWMMWRNRRPGLAWWQREYWQMYRLLERHGVAVAPSLDARGLARQAAIVRPGARDALLAWLRLYERVVYATGEAQPRTLHRELRRQRRSVASALR